jgi:antitoxin PrlF
MPRPLEEISTITAKGQTTVPKAVRQALGVDYGGKIAFRVDGRGVSVRRAEDDDSDPVVDSFLEFLARDMSKNPGAVQPLSPDLATRIAAASAGFEVDLEAEIEGDVEL